MTEFRLTQISDTHLARRLQTLTDNFHRVSEHIDATRPDLVINSGDLHSTGRPAATISIRQGTARRPSGSLPSICPAITTSATIQPRSGRPRASGDREGPAKLSRCHRRSRWRFDEAGWCFIGLNSLIMNTGIESEAEQFDWLASDSASANGKPVALFLHKPLFLNAPDDPELEASAIRYVPQPPAF